MEFNETESTKFGEAGSPIVKFDIDRSEVEQARLGFEASGQLELSELVAISPGFGVDQYEKARLVVAGNIALVNSLKGIFVPKTIASVSSTIESGLRSLQEADEFIAENPDYK